MAAGDESAASFKHRCTEMGLSAAEINALETQNMKTFNDLASAAFGQHGQLDAGRFQRVMDGTFLAPMEGLQSMMRQLSYGAITVAVAAIRVRVEPQQEGQSKQLPPLEHDERIREQSASITGFTILGEYELLVDFLTTMSKECAPCYTKNISTEQELQSQRVDKRIVVLEDQQLQVESHAPDAVADLSTSLEVQNAFIRRGLACWQDGLMS